VNRPPAIIGIGRNYAKHAEELGSTRPEHPLIFFKNPASVIGDGDPIVIPSICAVPEHGVDYEGELAAIIGEDCKDVLRAEGLAAISHYAVANDVSHRWWQWEGSGGQFCRGKGFDSFCPMSEPVAAELVGDPQELRITTRLNGATVQDASTSEMLFPIADLVAELSRGTTLLKGTVILTGTPAGVGAAQDPPRFLVAGDTIEVEIDRVGVLRNPVQ
jgi:2-keto-4-pentenoate hydratase/2-oxohepta-3-ene-1,7-dioic acid hydratase in catechol pathway